MYNRTIQHEIAQEAIRSMTTSKIILLWNEFCDENGYESINRYDEETINWLLRDKDPMEIIKLTNKGSFKADAEYITFDGNGNIKTLTAKDALEEVDYDQLAEMIVYDLDFYKKIIPEIAEAFEEYEEENNDSEEELYT